MAGRFDKQAGFYADARPTYPTEWYSMLAALTPHHSLAWDVGTGNGQAAIGVSPFCPSSISLIQFIIIFLLEFFFLMRMPIPPLLKHLTIPSKVETDLGFRIKV